VKRSLVRLLVVTLALGVLAACGSDDKKESGGSSDTTAANAAGVKVTIGAQKFGESAILAEIYKQGLAAKGYDTSIKELGGFRDLEMTAFEQKTINFAPEYAATLLEFLNNKKGEATGDSTETYDKLDPYLKPKGLAALRPSAAVDTNAFVVTKKTSEELGIKSLSDLASKGKDLKIGAPADCSTNPFCIPGLKKTYGLDLSSKFTALEPGQVADALDAGSIDVGLLFSTDGTIASKDYVLLEDDEHMLAADTVLPIVTIELRDTKGFVAAVNAITEPLDTDKLIGMNKRFDIDKEDAAVIAKDFLTKEKLL
jgi:osmoprotectant transport system substrate-binding protein